MKRVGVVGLGLIGGSFLKAYKVSEQWEVFGFDIDDKISKIALLARDMDGELSRENIGECDLILLALYPKAAVQYIQEMGKYISKDAIVIDCCGIKRGVCDQCFTEAKKYGFTYVGGHPMAGTHFSGYKYSRPTLFSGATMIIVPEDFNDIVLLDNIKTLLAPAKFKRITVSTASNHDKMIAFTSQMAHVVSNAYIKSPTAAEHKGFSAGSYKDLTRVAWLNEIMWTELFMENRDNLIAEVDYLIENLKKYKEALLNGDEEMMISLLAEGRKRKEEIDGV